MVEAYSSCDRTNVKITVLGPTHFLIYINDTIDNIHYSKIRFFADVI